jgi:hypothetical protein
MRVMLKVQIPVEHGNAAIAGGSLPSIIEQAAADLQPEAMYFTEEDGLRTGLFFFDMPDSTYLPFAAERFFTGLNAKLTVRPVMNLEDLQTALGRLQ